MGEQLSPFSYLRTVFWRGSSWAQLYCGMGWLRCLEQVWSVQLHLCPLCVSFWAFLPKSRLALAYWQWRSPGPAWDPDGGA